jgi:hypothetical protein
VASGAAGGVGRAGPTGHVSYDLPPNNFAIPMLGGVATPPAGYNVRALYGTAFPLGDAVLLTANHVVENAEVSGTAILVGWPPATFNEPINVSAGYVAQKWPSVDLAAVFVPNVRFPVLHWDARTLPLLTEVHAVGFPYGVDLAHRTLVHRAFRGPIAGSLSFPSFRGAPRSMSCSFQLLAACRAPRFLLQPGELRAA